MHGLLQVTYALGIERIVMIVQLSERIAISISLTVFG